MCWHKWGKWTEPKQVPWRYWATPWSEPLDFFKSKQSRTCSKCGKTQHRYI